MVCVHVADDDVTTQAKHTFKREHKAKIAYRIYFERTQHYIMNTIMTTYSILSLLLILLKVSVICISVDAFLLRTISVPVVYQSKFKRSRSTTCTGISFAYKQPELELECDEVTKTNIAYTVDRARNIAFNYDGPVEEFNPPEWFRNPHVQTIVGGLFRQQTMFYTGLDDALKAITSADDKSTFIEWDEQKRYTTPDGDLNNVVTQKNELK